MPPGEGKSEVISCAEEPALRQVANNLLIDSPGRLLEFTCKEPSLFAKVFGLYPVAIEEVMSR